MIRNAKVNPAIPTGSGTTKCLSKDSTRVKPKPTVHAIIPVSNDSVTWQKLVNVGELALDHLHVSESGKRRYLTRAYSAQEQKRVWDVFQVSQSEGRIRPTHPQVQGAGSSSGVTLPERGPDPQSQISDELVITDEPEPNTCIRMAKSARSV